MSQPRTNTLLPMQRMALQYVGGPVSTVVALLAIELWSRTVFTIPNPAVVLVLAVLFAALHGGLLPGVISAGIAWVYLAVFFLFPNQPRFDTATSVHHMVILTLAMPALVAMVTIWKRRAERAFERSQANAVLQAQLVERQRAAELVEASEAHLRTMLETEPECVKLLGPDCLLLDMNPAGLAMLEVEAAEDVLGRSVLDLIVPEHREAFRSLNDRVLGGASGTLEFEIVGVKGTHRWLETHVAPLRGPHGNIIAALSITRDITERTRLAEALRQSTQRLQEQYAELEQLYRTAPVGLALLDPDRRYIRINERLAAANGRPAAEHIGHTVRDMLPELADQVERLHSQVLACAMPVLDIEVHGVTQADPGAARDWLASYYPLLSEDNRVSGVSVVVQDITECKRTELALRDSEERYRRLFNTASDGIFVCNVTAQGLPGSFREINDYGCQMLGYSREELGQLTPTDLEAPENVPDFAQAFHNFLQRPHAPIERTLIAKDGRRIPVEIRGQPFEFQGQCMIQAIVRDVSARKQAEEERQKLVALIAHSTDFIGVATLDARGTYLNDAGGRLVGLDPADVSQTTIFDFFPEDAQTQVRETILPTLMSTGQWQGETRFQHFTSGHAIPVDMIAFMVHHPDTHAPLCLATVSRDIRERKEIEATRAAETRFLQVQTAILQAALTTLDPALLRSRLLTIVTQTQGYAHGLWWQRTADGQDAVVVATHGEKMAPLLGVRRAISDPSSFAAHTIRAARPQYCNRVQESPYVYNDQTRSLQQQALLGWPLLTHTGQLSGALTFADTTDPEHFNALDMAQGATLATLIAQTIERSEFFDRLQRLEAQYRTVTEAMHDGLLMVDLEGQITYANTALAQLLGMESAALLGRPATDLFASGVAPTILERPSRALQGEPASPYFQTELRHRDGWRIAVELAITTLSHGDQIVGRVGVVRDIRRRLQVQAEMEQRRRETEILGELAQSLNASLDLDTVLQRVVTGAQELCASDGAKIALWDSDQCAMRFRCWVGQRYPGYAQLRIEPGKGLGGYVIQTGRCIAITNYAEDLRFTNDYQEVNRIDGFQAEIVLPIIIAQQVEGLLYVSNRSADSFTEPHAASLRRLADHAAVAIRNAQLYRELDAFVYTASHDLKAPLVSIEGYSAMLHTEFCVALGAEGQHYLARIRANVAHMHTLITDLLELSRIGRALGAIETIDMVALLREVQEALALTLAQTGAELVVPAALPTIRGDRSRIRQVFINLTENAVKYRSQERRLRIEVGYQQTDDVYRFYVADNGIGIAPRHHEQIFAPFRKLTAASEGVGMGLALVHKIVQHHGGQVWVESEAGAGATFYFTLPVMRNNAREFGSDA